MEHTLPALLALPRFRIVLESVTWAGVILLGIAIGSFTNSPDGRIFYDVPWPADYAQSSILTVTNNYSPAFVWWIQPTQELPWTLFKTLIATAEMLSLAYLLGPLVAIGLVVLQAPLIWEELLSGNLNLVMAALLVWGFQRPGLYAIPMLTKVTPGIALIWFAVRREWWALTEAAAVTLLLALPAIVLLPNSWIAWAINLISNDTELRWFLPPSVHILIGAALVAYAAKTDRRWLLPIAVAVASLGGFRWVIALGALRLYLTARSDVVEEGAA